MPSLTLTVSQDWATRFEDYARDAVPWEGPGPDTRTPTQLFRAWVSARARRDILNYERNLRAETGGKELDEPT